MGVSRSDRPGRFQQLNPIYDELATVRADDRGYGRFYSDAGDHCNSTRLLLSVKVSFEECDDCGFSVDDFST
jgi:hypothetical protein